MSMTLFAAVVKAGCDAAGLEPMEHAWPLTLEPWCTFLKSSCSLLEATTLPGLTCASSSCGTYGCIDSRRGSLKPFCCAMRLKSPT